MTKQMELDLTELRRMWSERRARLDAILRRVDTRGMTRPARDPEERAWLAEQAGRSGPFVEDERAAAAARAYYERRYHLPA